MHTVLRAAVAALLSLAIIGLIRLASAQDSAPPKGEFQTLPGFKVEHLYTVPKETQGSWVSLTLDNKGRLIACDQGDKGLYRITPPAIGEKGEAKVEKLNVNMSAAQGLLYAFDSLYASVNNKPDPRKPNGAPGSGLYRLRDTNGDDQFDEVVKLREFEGPVGEHGPHALRLTPDGKSILIVCGNHTDLPFQPSEMKDHPEYTSLLPANWDEDLLLPRLWDPNGHARGRMAPGGWIAETDPDGKHWKIITAGYRNSYDFDFNADGEMFVYDSDMEWDIGSPWYRATRLVHAPRGSEFGWRSGAGVWPWYFVDSLPPALDVGPGSPVGVTFGYGAKFPAKYQKSLFILDWTFGTIYAMHIEPEGATYKATREEFISRSPLPLTDAVIGKDGAMYFTIGGRNTQSELFRVVYTGEETTAPVDAHDSRNKELRDLRHKLEAYQEHAAADPKKAVDELLPNLGHGDRFIRYAARVGLEFQPIELWQERVLSSNDPETLITGIVGIAHQGPKTALGPVVKALNSIDFDKLNPMQQLEMLRAYQLAFIRLGEPDEAMRAGVLAKLDSKFPGENDLVNRELNALLVYLQSPTVVQKSMAVIKKETPPSAHASDETMRSELIARNNTYGKTIREMLEHHPDMQKIQYAYNLRNAKIGWTLDDYQAFFKFLREAGRSKGGHSFDGFLKNIDADAFANATDAQRLAIEATGARKPFTVPKLPSPDGPGHDWTMDEVIATAQDKLKGRDFDNGKKTFAAARCVVCHRFNGDGGATGPDLTQLAGRFTLKDLTESIMDPSKVVSDQYKATSVLTSGGKSYTGRIITENKNVLIMVTDPEDSTKIVEIKKSDVESQQPSPISLMPQGLLKPLSEREVLDLLAFLLSRGDPKDAMFKK
jgi:putative heme-binding domain-containing protein